MQTVLYNISQVLGITIIHSLWQGLLIYFILRIAFAGISSLTAVKKYNLAIGAMVAISVCFIYTLLTEISDYSWVTLKPAHQLPLLPYLNLPTGTHYHQDWYYSIARYLPFICAFYFMGLIINIARLAVEWNKIQQIKLSVLPAEQLQQFVNVFSKKLNINKYITLKFSELIDVPCMIGYFKPLILLPVSIGANLSTAEVEAILLHELSHIKRNDYLVNLLQQVITVLLFFNPFTQLINRIVNQERENVCDDLVVEKTGEPLIYAQALIKLEEARKSNLQLALAATGPKFQLLNRIERIMKTKKHMASMRHLIIALFLLAGTLSCIAWFNPKAAIAKAKLTKGTSADTLIDSTQYNLLTDTTKHKYKAKSKVIAKNRKQKVKAEKASSSNKTEIYDDNFYSDDAPDSVKRYFNSPEWKAQMETMRKQGEEMRKKFNSPEWKSQMEAMRKQGEEMNKKFRSAEWKNQMLAMRKQGEEMRKKFDSPEWKNQMLAMQKQGEEMKKHFDSPEWKNQVEAMKKQGEEMQKKFNSPEWKSQMEVMKKQGELMKKHFDSPEWKKQVEVMKKQGEEMQKKFNSPEWKKQVETMKKQFDSPEWKNQMEKIKKQGELMRKQFDSPEWRNKMKNRKWIMRDSVGKSRTYTPEKDSTTDKEQPVKEDQQ
ncbi:MAG: M48 family metalloprotease [Bacteroidota bacterium]|nr:M48 family metalloprotease [Bacteroidota bacterium]